MANFKTHITTSTVVGIGYGAAGYFLFDMPLATSMLAAGGCSVAGMLPDLDSDNGVPVREMMSFLAAITPVLMLERFRQMNFTPEMIALASGLIYIMIRFGVSELFKRYTTHRGMWHSIPAAATAGLLAFLVCSNNDFEARLFKSLAVVIGFMVHLVLDEIWSFEWQGGRVRVKRSFGTAIKFFGPSVWGNVSTYGKLIILIGLVVGDPMLMELIEPHQSQHDAVRFSMDATNQLLR